MSLAGPAHSHPLDPEEIQAFVVGFLRRPDTHTSDIDGKTVPSVELYGHLLMGHITNAREAMLVIGELAIWAHITVRNHLDADLPPDARVLLGVDPSAQPDLTNPEHRRRLDAARTIAAIGNDDINDATTIARPWLTEGTDEEAGDFVHDCMMTARRLVQRVLNP